MAQAGPFYDLDDDAFPLPMPAARTVEKAGRGGARFLVASMYTASYADRAERLRASCERFGLPYLLQEVPTIHNSISARGTPDLRYTKANFIRTLLEQRGQPVLYVDTDCVFRAYPALLDEFLDGGTDFAVFNWAADPDNEAFYPIDVRSGGRVFHGRFYAFSHRVASYAPEQLLCTGCVQLYRSSPGIDALLERWHRTVRRFPGTADDSCLAFAFNNREARFPAIRSRWLPKEYVRRAYWIYVKPVIDHPDLSEPGAGLPSIPDGPQGREFYRERAEIIADRFSESCIVDIQARTICVAVDGKLAVVGPTDWEFWVDPQQRALATMNLEIP
jgi:hypothetical protein